jgi:nucleotide-binding universal stress UspA family protein
MNTNQLIAVGVDGSEGGRRALRWAVAEAAQLGVAVQAIIVWRWEGIETLPPLTYSPADERVRAEKTLRRAVLEVPEEERRGVRIAEEVVEGRPADVLTAATRGARLLVLGSHGHGRVWHSVLGSVSHACIRNAACPVVIVPVPRPASAPAEPALRS